MTRFPCPYLQGEVELTQERERHIADRHSDLLPEYRDCIAETVLEPDEVRLSARLRNARLFTRWFESVRGDKYVVVITVSDATPTHRHWFITAYITRKLGEGTVEWKKI